MQRVGPRAWPKDLQNSMPARSPPSTKKTEMFAFSRFSSTKKSSFEQLPSLRLSEYFAMDEYCRTRFVGPCLFVWTMSIRRFESPRVGFSIPLGARISGRNSLIHSPTRMIQRCWPLVSNFLAIVHSPKLSRLQSRCSVMRTLPSLASALARLVPWRWPDW